MALTMEDSAENKPEKGDKEESKTEEKPHETPLKMIKMWKSRMWYHTVRPENVASLLREEAKSKEKKDSKKQKYPRIAIIDARKPKQDFPGGNIPNCLNIDHEDFILALDKIINKFGGSEYIIFHCMFSQVLPLSPSLPSRHSLLRPFANNKRQGDRIVAKGIHHLCNPYVKTMKTMERTSKTIYLTMTAV